MVPIAQSSENTWEGYTDFLDTHKHTHTHTHTRITFLNNLMMTFGIDLIHIKPSAKSLSMKRGFKY